MAATGRHYNIGVVNRTHSRRFQEPSIGAPKGSVGHISIRHPAACFPLPILIYYLSLRPHRVYIHSELTATMSEPVHSEPPTSQPATATPGPSHPSNVFVTFPIVFINNPPPAAPRPTPQTTTSPTDDSTTLPEGAQQRDNNGSAAPQINSEQYWVNLMLQTVEGLPVMLQRLGPFMSQGPFTGPFESVPSGPPKKHATQTALDKLASVDVASLPEEERRCTICMQEYYVKPTGPRSPYVEDVRDEEDFGGDDVISNIAKRSLIAQEETFQEPNPKEEEEGEAPVRMPCGHIFGATCLKEWLYQSPTCPLCRVEVESYTEEPQPVGFPPFAHLMFETQMPMGPQRPDESEQSNEMQVDPPEPNAPADESAEPERPQTEPSSNATPTPHPPQFHPLAFQIIFTSPPSNVPSPAAAPPVSATPAPPPSTPSISRSSTPSSRPTTSHSIRHHPYARTSTPSPLSGPSITDRPDLFCAQRLSGLCPHEPTDESHIRLECGHAFHNDCLESSMAIEGYAVNNEERRCPRCRRWTHIMQ